MTFEQVLVVGAGQMGSGIAQVVAASGRHVLLHDPYPGAVERGLAGIGASLAKLAEKGAVAEPEAVLARIAPVDGLRAADLMIEAIVEDRVQPAPERARCGPPARGRPSRPAPALGRCRAGRSPEPA